MHSTASLSAAIVAGLQILRERSPLTGTLPTISRIPFEPRAVKFQHGHLGTVVLRICRNGQHRRKIMLTL